MRDNFSRWIDPCTAQNASHHTLADGDEVCHDFPDNDAAVLVLLSSYCFSRKLCDARVLRPINMSDFNQDDSRLGVGTVGYL